MGKVIKQSDHCGIDYVVAEKKFGYTEVM